MHEWTRNWIRLRAEHSALRRGRLIDLFYDDDAYMFARQTNRETVIVAMNRSKQEKQVTIPAAAIGLKDGVRLAPLIGTSDTSLIANGSATVNIPPKAAVAYK
jgi:glycosidase